MGVLTLIAGLAGPIFLPLAGFLVDHFEWRVTARILALIFVVVGVATAAMLPDHHGDRRAAKRRSRLREFVADRRFLLFSGAVMPTFGAMQALFFHRIAVFEEAGFSVALVATWAGIASVISLPGRFVAPLLGDRFGGLRLHAAVVAGMAASVVVVIMADATWVMVVHFVLFGVAFGGLSPPLAVIMARWYSGPDYGHTVVAGCCGRRRRTMGCRGRQRLHRKLWPTIVVRT